MSVTPTSVAVSSTVPTLTLAAGTSGGVAVASTIDPAVDYLLIYTNSAEATQGINRNTLLGLSSAPLGLTDTQSPTNKTFNNTNAYTTLDGSFTLENTSDATKKAVFSLAGITTGTTRTYTLPNATDTLVGLAATQTLTNKTLTSPTINSPNITNASITADAITGYTTSNTGTVYGMSVSGGLMSGSYLTSASVTSTQLGAAAVTPTKLATGAATATVLTSETTTSTSYTDLATAGPSVTVTIGANGLALISISAYMANSAASGDAVLMSFVVSGASTIAVGTAPYVMLYQTWTTGAFGEMGSTWLVSGLTAGSTTFKAQYAVSGGGTGTWKNRNISVVPL